MNSRNQSLDVLRGFAVLLVMCAHYQLFAAMGHGWIGVDLFFVLSGFLISGLLFTDMKMTGRINMVRFYIRRGLKIYPSLYLLLLIAFPILGSSLLVETVFLQNYFPPKQALTNYELGHLWSLAVEEHFYIALPVILILLNRFRRLQWIPLISAVVMIFCFLARVPYCAVHGNFVYPTHLRVDALFVGVAIGYFHNYRPEVFARLSGWWSLPCTLLLLIPVLTNASGSMVFTANLLAFALLVAWSVPRALKGLKYVGRIGVYSYSIYLVHAPLATIWQMKPVTWLRFLGYVISSLLVGVVMARLIEFPVLAIREHFFPKTSGSGLPQQRRVPSPQEAPMTSAALTVFFEGEQQ